MFQIHKVCILYQISITVKYSNFEKKVIKSNFSSMRRKSLLYENIPKIKMPQNFWCHHSIPNFTDPI